jgi:beta-lactamase class A
MIDALTALVRNFRGVIGVAVTDLASGEEVALHGDQRFPTASTIKVAVMVEAWRQIAAGRLSLDTPLLLEENEKVGGAGVLRDLQAGIALPVRDLLHLMIALSDNTATNLLVARLGTANVDAMLDGLGLGETRLFRPTFRDGRADVLPELEREYGLGMTTPREMARLMALIAEGRAVSVEASAAMLATLRRQQDRAMIPRLLPSDGSIEIGNKTGTDQEKLPCPDGTRGQVRADVAIVTGSNLRYVIAIFARHVADQRKSVDNDALVTGARISRLVYERFTGR